MNTHGDTMVSLRERVMWLQAENDRLLHALEELSSSPTARIDAKEWVRYFKKTWEKRKHS